MSYGTLSSRQAQVVSKLVSRRVVHDLGAGCLGLTKQLLELGARRVVAVDRRIDFSGGVPSGVTFKPLSFVDLAKSKEHVGVAFVSWPPQYGTEGLARVLGPVPTVIYLGVNTKETVCGSKQLFEHFRKREVLHYIEDPANDLIVYGPRRTRREPNGHEYRAELGYNWLGGADPERAEAMGRKTLQRLLEQCAADEEAQYRISKRQERRASCSKG